MNTVYRSNDGREAIRISDWDAEKDTARFVVRDEDNPYIEEEIVLTKNDVTLLPVEEWL